MTTFASVRNSLCVNGKTYTTSQDDEFTQDTVLNTTSGDINGVVNPTPSAMWSTEFSWGRVNNWGADDAYYADPTLFPYYNPFSLSSGVLSITATPITKNLGNPLLLTRHWLSGTLEGKPLTYGYVEVSAEEPNIVGFWPAPLWLLGYHGADGKGNGYAEIDGNEIFGNALPKSTVQQTQILNNANPRGARDVRTIVAPDPSLSFHTYGILWTPQTVTFFIDRRPTSIALPNAATGPMNPLITLQVFAQSTWAPPPTQPLTPKTMKLQYFRWYQSTGYACSPSAIVQPSGSTLPPSPTPTPLPNESTPISIVQASSVQPAADYEHATATLRTLPRTGDMLILTAAVNNELSPPQGWHWLLGAGPQTLDLMYGIVGQDGLVARTSYNFGGNQALMQLFEFQGVNTSFPPSVSTDPMDYGLARTRTLPVQSAGGMGLIVWGARSSSSVGGIFGETNALSIRELATSLTKTLNFAMPGGSALSLCVSRTTTDPYLAAQPFSVTGTFQAGNAPSLIINGNIIWLRPV